MKPDCFIEVTNKEEKRCCLPIHQLKTALILTDIVGLKTLYIWKIKLKNKQL